MPIFAWDGSWKKVQSLFVQDSGEHKEVLKKYVWDNGVWNLVYQPTGVVVDPTYADLASAPWAQWSLMPGVAVTPTELAVTGIDRRLYPTPLDEADSVPIRAVNNEVYLEFTGDFKITVGVRMKADADLNLTFYGLVPMVQDEWRGRNASLSFSLNRWGDWSGNNGTIYWDRNSPTWDWDGEWGNQDVPMGRGSVSGSFDFVIQRVGNVISAFCSGTNIYNWTETANMFPDNRVYFSFSEGNVGEVSWITGVNAEALTGTVTRKRGGSRVLPIKAGGLRDLSATNQSNFRIGTAVSAHPLGLEPRYGEVLAGEFNNLVAENSMKFQIIQPQPGVYDFTEADMIVDFAEKNGMSIHGHCFMWDEAHPEWLSNPSLTPAQLETIMIDHVTTVVTRYAGRVESWDVINEPFVGFTSTLRPNVWMQAMGATYINKALIAAHNADPAAKLFINEWGVEGEGPKRDAIIALFTNLLAAGVPIHGVGLQMHEDVNAEYQETWPDDTPSTNRATFINAVAAYKALGLEFRVSEMDVNRHQTYPTTEVEMGRYYWDILDVCINEGAYAFSMWGFTDKWSSNQGWWNYWASGNSLIMNAAYEPKLAYDGLILRLKNLSKP